MTLVRGALDWESRWGIVVVLSVPILAIAAIVIGLVALPSFGRLGRRQAFIGITFGALLIVVIATIYGTIAAFGGTSP